MDNVGDETDAYRYYAVKRAIKEISSDVFQENTTSRAYIILPMSNC